MLNGDWLTPLAAGVMCRENQLPQDRSLAVTAAALVLNGPLALAPALVAVERKRRQDALAAAAREEGSASAEPVTGSAAPPATAPPVEKARPLVPDLIGKYDADGAEKEIRRLNLVPDPHLSWDEAATKGQVFAQTPVAGPNVRVPEGSVISYYLSNGPQPAAPAAKPGDDDAAISELRKDMDARFDALADLITKGSTTAPSSPPSPPVEQSTGAGGGTGIGNPKGVKP